jgi:hypothetical protein
MRTFYEPWTATASVRWQDSPGVTLGETDAIAGPPPERDWIVWAHMAEPDITVSLTGKPALDDGRRIVATVHRTGAWPSPGPSAEDVAKRIAACVTALAGVANPEQFMTDVRALLMRCARHDDFDGDLRVSGLLARCIKPETLEEEHASEEIDD